MPILNAEQNNCSNWVGAVKAMAMSIFEYLGLIHKIGLVV
jgi:hypothetical protein